MNRLSSTSISTISLSISPASTRRLSASRLVSSSCGSSSGSGSGSMGLCCSIAAIASPRPCMRGPGPPPRRRIASSKRSIESCSARSLTPSTFSARTIRTAASTRSRTIESTSRPTYPTSVYLLASTFTSGARTSFASRRAISVFPTPVGPIIRMFFGITSSLMSSGSCCRRIRFRSAIATDRFASACPTIYLSSAATIRRGVRSSNCLSIDVSVRVAIVLAL